MKENRSPTKINTKKVNINDELVKETKWLDSNMLNLSNDYEKGKEISWEAYHGSCCLETHKPNATISMLPPFYQKADLPAMIKHGMTVLQQITQYLNLRQTSVLTCDCPIFAQTKYLQWQRPELCGEEKFTIVFGELHIKKIHCQL